MRDQYMQITAVDGCLISLAYCLENHVKKEFGLIHIDFLYVWDFKGCISLHVLTPDMRNCDCFTHATFRPELFYLHKCISADNI